ncbi:uncharacterized protein LOC128853582 isoform X2 [Cuculus canorus]|uniref:uncharacterized protein LOC128853582 isoform X2 n=1 Tax=Cuculus canorus TaxID=55661 RepID=UPI0023AAE839|nr:uncharacterized protein LOC128853582 isoform X2 [Cuculus canorus]
MLMICITSIDAISLPMETSNHCWLHRVPSQGHSRAVYTTKLLLKLHVNPIAYWKSSYSLDTTVFLTVLFPHVLPVDTTACTHLQETTKGLQTRSILELIEYNSRMRVDGWTNSQCEMDHYGFTSSHVFTLLGNFIFFTSLVALVITQTQGLTQKSKQDCEAVKAAAVRAKKRKILKKAGKNVSN